MPNTTTAGIDTHCGTTTPSPHGLGVDDGDDLPANKREKPTQHGTWTGIGVGALVGIVFPPSIVGSAIVGGTAGGVIGHLSRRMSRGDLKDLGEALDDGNAALIVMGESRIDEQIEKALKGAEAVGVRRGERLAIQGLLVGRPVHSSSAVPCAAAGTPYVPIWRAGRRLPGDVRCVRWVCASPTRPSLPRDGPPTGASNPQDR